jgi:hypothetical protein
MITCLLQGARHDAFRVLLTAKRRAREAGHDLYERPVKRLEEQ